MNVVEDSQAKIAAVLGGKPPPAERRSAGRPALSSLASSTTCTQARRDRPAVVGISGCWERNRPNKGSSRLGPGCWNDLFYGLKGLQPPRNGPSRSFLEGMEAAPKFRLPTHALGPRLRPPEGVGSKSLTTENRNGRKAQNLPGPAGLVPPADLPW